MKLKTSLIIISLVGTIVSAFSFGNFFYYDRKITILARQTPIPLDNRLVANIASASQLKFKLKSQDREFPVDPQEFKNWTESYTRFYTNKPGLRVNTERVKIYLEELSKKISEPPTNPRLTISDGKITEFEPSKAGRTINIFASLANVTSTLARNESLNNNGKIIIAELVFDEVQSSITLDKVNNLGINTLLASGESDFSGSPKSRVHNITVGSKKFTGTLIAPGNEFSFNQTLGQVDASTGYLPEMVIKKGTITPEYGGGLCQVSTTLFRAVAFAGLPVLERHPHSLAVRYYNPQGFDATIYPGVSDFRFRNDTLAYILIQSKIVSSKLYFEIYGTKDGRKVALEGPRQYDIQPSGALKAELVRTVIYPDGTEKKDVFWSSYKPVSAAPVVRNPLE